MYSTVMNEFMKLIMKNKDVIDNVHFFDEVEVDDSKVQGTEIRLKNYDVRMNYLDTEDHYHRINPFRRDIPGYVYIIIGIERAYEKWKKAMIAGMVASKLIQKYPQIIDGGQFDRDQMEADRILFTKEIVDKS